MSVPSEAILPGSIFFFGLIAKLKRSLQPLKKLPGPVFEFRSRIFSSDRDEFIEKALVTLDKITLSYLIES